MVVQPDRLAAEMQAELTFADQGGRKWDDFWQRFGGPPDFHDKTVLDFGCNRGGSLDRALREGAARATGIDSNPYTTQYARERLGSVWGDRVEVLCGDIEDLAPGPFDLVMSTNTMEHVENVEGALGAMVRACRPGGELYIGFSPLWYSPYGNHGYPRSRVPWNHLLRGEDMVLDDLARHTGIRYESIADAGFNQATPARFRKALARQPVDIVSARRNVGRSRWRTLVSQSLLALAVLPALEKYVTVGFYWHLRRPPLHKEDFA